MTIELASLAWATVLGLAHAILTGQFTTVQHGLRYGLGPRDERKTLAGIGARVERAFANYMQTFPFFAAVILVAHVAGRHSWMTVTGAQLYLWGRIVYVPLYAAGIPVARTLAFLIATTGIALVLVALA